MIDEWLRIISNADMADWITVATYLLASLLSRLAARQACSIGKPSEVHFWRISTVLLVLLGINELLDLQALLTVVARAHARTHGWYDQHREVQLLFMEGLAGSAVLAVTAAALIARRMHIMVRLALVGYVFIVAFVLVRAASFNRMDLWLGQGMPEFPLGSFQEVSGTLMVAAAAAIYRWRA